MLFDRFWDPKNGRQIGFLLGVFDHFEVDFLCQFRKESLPPNVGYRRDQITDDMLKSPFELYNFIYSSSRQGKVWHKLYTI